MPLRKARIGKPKAGTRRALEARLDRAWAAKVREAGRCAACPSTGPLDAAHGIRRGYLATRRDSRNGFPLCRGCHRFYTEHPDLWDRWLIVTWGLELYDELWALARKGPKEDGMGGDNWGGGRP